MAALGRRAPIGEERARPLRLRGNPAAPARREQRAGAAGSISQSRVPGRCDCAASPPRRPAPPMQSSSRRLVALVASPVRRSQRVGCRARPWDEARRRSCPARPGLERRRAMRPRRNLRQRRGEIIGVRDRSADLSLRAQRASIGSRHTGRPPSLDRGIRALRSPSTADEHLDARCAKGAFVAPVDQLLRTPSVLGGKRVGLSGCRREG